MFKMFERHGEKVKRTGAPKSSKKRENDNIHDDAPKSKAPRSRASDTQHSKKAKDADKAADKSAKDKATKTNSDAKNPIPKKVASNDVTALVNSSDPCSFVHRRISKDFDGTTFFGTILKYDDSDDPPLWSVVYDDGDREDYEKRDLIKALKHYGIHRKYDAHKS